MTCATVNPLAEPFTANAEARTAVLVCHGFSGCVLSVRGWAQALAGQGLRVEAPRLPGHGTHWRELATTRWTDWYACVERAYRRLEQESDQVFVAGLSMGGALALRLAEEHAPAGAVLVNPSIGSDELRMRFVRPLSYLVPSVGAIANDIALPGADECGYPRTPLSAVASLADLWRVAAADLHRVECDVLLMTSTEDHVVDGASARLLERGVRHLERLELPNSYHVATLDHDAELVNRATFDFVRAHVAAPVPGAGR